MPNFGTSQETSSNGLPRALQFSPRFTFQVKPENTLRLTKTMQIRDVRSCESAPEIVSSQNLRSY